MGFNLLHYSRTKQLWGGGRGVLAMSKELHCPGVTQHLFPKYIPLPLHRWQASRYLVFTAEEMCLIHMQVSS